MRGNPLHRYFRQKNYGRGIFFLLAISSFISTTPALCQQTEFGQQVLNNQLAPNKNGYLISAIDSGSHAIEIAATEDTNHPFMDQVIDPASTGELNTGEPDTEGRNEIKRIEALTKQILLDELELEKFNIRFRKNINPQPRWRGPRYFAFQETGAAMTAAGLFVGMYAQGRAMNHPVYKFDKQTGTVTKSPGARNKRTLKGSASVQMIGQIIAAAGSGIELSVNKYNDIKAKQNGFSSKTATSYVLDLRKKIEEQLKEREKIIAESRFLPSTYREVAEAEGKLLTDFCHIALYEHARFHIDALRFRATQNSLYTIDIAKNTTGAIGNYILLRQFQENRPHLGLGAGIMTLVSGVLISANPIASRGIGKVYSMLAKQRLKPVTAGISPCIQDKLDFDEKNLKAILQKYKDNTPEQLTGPILRDAIHEDHCFLNQKQFALSLRETRAASRVATQTTITGNLVGGTKISLGIANIIGGTKYAHLTRASVPLIDAGFVSYSAGTCYGLLENFRNILTAELQRKRLSKKRELPGQILDDRLKQLDKISASLQNSQ